MKRSHHSIHRNTERNSVSEKKKQQKMLKIFFCLRRNILYWEFESNPNKPNLA
jgi:hypothetical protein